MNRRLLALTVALVVALATPLAAAPPGKARLTLVFVLDGLRPDSINAEDTPTLHRLRAEGVSFEQSHAVHHPLMGPRRLMAPLRPGQGDGLLPEQFVQRGQPLRMHPREQVLARGRHPGQHRLHQLSRLPASPILRLRSPGSLCSLRHGRLLGPGVGDLVLVDAILTPTREPPLLSSQVQQGPGHLQCRAGGAS
jgi:hypothetical protein